ncbi:MAG: DUF4870 domain-containing protein, partial [Actinobacteria bacterium]|nr:DUF4870 domain-containing protein [Actinomycetota bacterium]
KQTVVDADFNAKSSTGMEPKIACLLAYLFSWLGGLIILLIEKENKFVKFHALQALILGIVEVICFVVISVILGMIPYVGWFLFSWLGWVLGAVCYVFAIIAIIKSFQGEKYYIPFLRGLVNKFNK